MEHDFITIGTARGYLGADFLLPLTNDARMRHTFVNGQTGTGKTNLLQHMAVSDLWAGNGFVFIDPHGQAANQLLKYVPKDRTQDVIYLNPADRERSFGLNLLEVRDDSPEGKDLQTQFIVSTFRYRWIDTWGARMQNIFSNTSRALLDVPTEEGGATLVSIPLMLTRKSYRDWVLKRCTDRATREYFAWQFDTNTPRSQRDWNEAILNKVQTFLSATTLRNIVGQQESTINPRYIMDNKKVLIVALEKGRLGNDVANAIGSLLVSAFSMAAMSRGDIEEEADRTDFFGYFDEFHNVTTGAFDELLSEVRKYRFGLTMASQYMKQIDQQEVLDAIIGNCGNFIAFRGGADDADKLGKTLGIKHDLNENPLLNMGTGQAKVRVLDKNNHPTWRHLTTHLIAPMYYVNRPKRVKRIAQEYYTTPRDQVDKEYNTFMDFVDGLEKPMKKPKRRNKNRGRKGPTSFLCKDGKLVPIVGR